MNTSQRARVLYADPILSQRLAALPYEELGRLDNGIWVACPDQTVRALAENNAPVFLYFDRVSYDSAVTDLSGPQVQEVIRRRKDRFAPDAKSYLMSWFYDLESVRLEAALQMWPPASPPIEKSLALLQFLAGLRRYQTLPAKAMGLTVLEAESLVVSTVRSAVENPIMDGTPEKSVLTGHLNRRQTWAAALRRVVAALGMPEFANAMPFADPVRGVFVHPAESSFERDLAKTGEPAVRWKEGLVYGLAERRFATLREQRFSVDVLYANAGDYYDGVESLTKPQLQRDFDGRLQRSAADTRRDFLEDIDRLHLHQILLKRELCGRADAMQACASAGMAALLPEEIEVLARALARSHTFSRREGFGQTTPRDLFETAENLFTADLALFGGIVSRYWPAIAPQLKEIEKFKNDGGISRP